jgi:tripartite-type tricarboxylate transporter receptor subunit TctC
MMPVITRRSAALALSSLAAPGSLRAQPLVASPVRFIIPYGTGGTADLVARMVGDRVGPAIGATIVPDYKPGANLIIGAQAAAEAAPDGRTLFMGTGTSQSLNPLLRSTLPYRANQFAAVSMMTENAYVMVVPPQSPARTLAEFIALAKARPGHLNYGSFGAGNITHLGIELLSQQAGLSMTNVPYRAGAQADLDLLGGRLDFLMTTLSILPHLQSGAARALAVTTPERIPFLPSVPTVAEQGFPGFDVRGWFAMFVPAGTPVPIVQRLSAEVNTALRDPAVAAAFSPQGLTAKGSTPEELERLIIAENTRWAPIIERLGLRDRL